jgi:NAD(P)-dependent dehydrogenase (short-subunit alcohol dehydrogenase family)
MVAGVNGGLPLDGQVVVITGAGSGIGRAMLDAFRTAGAAVLAADVSADRLAELASLDKVETVVTDVTIATDLDAMIDRAVAVWGRIDVLCNNAGRPDAFRGVEDCTDEEWELGLALHLTAAFLASRQAIPHMLAAGHGVILNTVSTAGLTGNNGGASYTASKHGLIGLTRSTAAMYGVDGIRAVAICPGAVDTDATEIMKRRRQSGEVSERFLTARDRTFKAFTRRAQPAEFGALAVYLAMGGADLLNGAVLPANSGYSAH